MRWIYQILFYIVKEYPKVWACSQVKLIAFIQHIKFVQMHFQKPLIMKMNAEIQFPNTTHFLIRHGQIFQWELC